MTTYSYSSVLDHTTDAGFRAWGAELSAGLDTIGAAKTADSGQINWTTTTRPASGAAAGYEIRKLVDSLSASAPVFIKLEFGTSGANAPGIWLTIGTGSNGSGTLTGILYARFLINPGTAPASTTTNYPTYMCMTAGALWLCWKVAANTSLSGRSYFDMVICRTVDDTGVITGDGISHYRNGQASNTAALVSYFSFTSTFAVLATTAPQQFGGNYTFAPLGLTTSVSGGSPASLQVFRHYTSIPLIRPLIHAVSSLNADGITLGTTFQVAPVGTTLHTYLCVQQALSFYDRFCLIWE